jgi:hypothetical protein
LRLTNQEGKKEDGNGSNQRVLGLDDRTAVAQIAIAAVPRLTAQTGESLLVRHAVGRIDDFVAS